MRDARPVDPEFSVITVVLNGARHLETCLQSIASQKNVNVEHIVIDGGSADGSVEILERWSSRLAFWQSEPDAGIADAMNKGIARATGEWIAFVHADDYLADPDVLAQARQHLDEDLDVAAFPVLFGNPPDLKQVNPRTTGWRTNFKIGMCHQGVLVHRRLFDRAGTFDASYKVCMDYELLLRAYRQQAIFRSFPSPVLAVMRNTGISSRQDWNSLNKRFSEERRVHSTHSNSGLMRLIYKLYWSFYLPYRRIRAAKFGRPM